MAVCIIMCFELWVSVNGKHTICIPETYHGHGASLDWLRCGAAFKTGDRRDLTATATSTQGYTSTLVLFYGRRRGDKNAARKNPPSLPEANLDETIENVLTACIQFDAHNKGFYECHGTRTPTSTSADTSTSSRTPQLGPGLAPRPGVLKVWRTRIVCLLLKQHESTPAYT